MSKRLLILACSARKTDHVLCPAIDRYLSPAFFVLRRWLKQNSENNTVVWILSAKYGLIPAHRRIEHYDTAMTETRAENLGKILPKQFRKLFKTHFADGAPDFVFCHLPKNYCEAITRQLDELRRSSCVSVAKGSPGIKLKFLKSWLEKEKVKICKS